MKNVKKFVVIYNANEKKGAQAQILTGWQLDSLLESKGYSDTVQCIYPLGARYTAPEYSVGRKLV
jgi:hypothetical protein